MGRVCRVFCSFHIHFPAQEHNKTRPQDDSTFSSLLFAPSLHLSRMNQFTSALFFMVHHALHCVDLSSFLHLNLFPITVSTSPEARLILGNHSKPLHKVRPTARSSQKFTYKVCSPDQSCGFPSEHNSTTLADSICPCVGQAG